MSRLLLAAAFGFSLAGSALALAQISPMPGDAMSGGMTGSVLHPQASPMSATSPQSGSKPDAMQDHAASGAQDHSMSDVSTGSNVMGGAAHP